MRNSAGGEKAGILSPTIPVPSGIRVRAPLGSVWRSTPARASLALRAMSACAGGAHEAAGGYSREYWSPSCLVLGGPSPATCTAAPNRLSRDVGSARAGGAGRGAAEGATGVWLHRGRQHHHPLPMGGKPL